MTNDQDYYVIFTLTTQNTHNCSFIIVISENKIIFIKSWVN